MYPGCTLFLFFSFSFSFSFFSFSFSFSSFFFLGEGDFYYFSEFSQLRKLTRTPRLLTLQSGIEGGGNKQGVAISGGGLENVHGECLCGELL